MYTKEANEIKPNEHYYDTVDVLAIILFRYMTNQSSCRVCNFRTWDPVSHPDLAGYYLFYGTASGNYNHQINVGNILPPIELAGLTQGRHLLYCNPGLRFGKYDTSPFSNEIVIYCSRISNFR